MEWFSQIQVGFSYFKFHNCGWFCATENFYCVVCCRLSAHCAENTLHYHASSVYKITADVYKYELFLYTYVKMFLRVVESSSFCFELGHVTGSIKM